MRTLGHRPGSVSAVSLAIAVAAAALVGLAALAGQWIGRRDAAQPSRSETAVQVHALGPMRVAVPAEWRRLLVGAAGLPGIEARSTVVFDPAPGLSARAVLMLQPLTSGVSPSLLPTPLLRAAGSPPGRPRSVRLDGRRAWMYVAVPTKRTAETMDITVVPTTAGIVAVACMAPRTAFSAAVACASRLRLALDPARPIRPTVDLAFELRLGEVALRFDRERVEQRLALSRARTPRAQARAARRVATTHARAARALAPFARGGEATEVVALLRASSREYDALARSVAAQDRGAFKRASRAIDEADARLALRLRPRER